MRRAWVLVAIAAAVATSCEPAMPPALVVGLTRGELGQIDVLVRECPGGEFAGDRHLHLFDDSERGPRAPVWSIEGRRGAKWPESFEIGTVPPGFRGRGRQGALDPGRTYELWDGSRPDPLIFRTEDILPGRVWDGNDQRSLESLPERCDEVLEGGARGEARFVFGLLYFLVAVVVCIVVLAFLAAALGIRRRRVSHAMSALPPRLMSPWPPVGYDADLVEQPWKRMPATVTAPVPPAVPSPPPGSMATHHLDGTVDVVLALSVCMFSFTPLVVMVKTDRGALPLVAWLLAIGGWQAIALWWVWSLYRPHPWGRNAVRVVLAGLGSVVPLALTLAVSSSQKGVWPLAPVIAPLLAGGFWVWVIAAWPKVGTLDRPQLGA